MIQPFLTAGTLVAGFWHIFWVAGVAVLATGLLGVAVHSAGYARLDQDQQPTSQQPEQPGDAESQVVRKRRLRGM